MFLPCKNNRGFAVVAIRLGVISAGSIMQYEVSGAVLDRT